MAVRRSAIKKRKDLRKIEKGQVHVHATSNNTIVTVTDIEGNTISWAAAGSIGYKGARRSTAFAAQQVTEKAINEAAKNNGLRRVEVFIKGPGNGREAAIRAIQASNIDITMIKDVSPIPHNGCRPPKKRRL